MHKTKSYQSTFVDAEEGGINQIFFFQLTRKQALFLPFYSLDSALWSFSGLHFFYIFGLMFKNLALFCLIDSDIWIRPNVPARLEPVFLPVEHRS